MRRLLTRKVKLSLMAAVSVICLAPLLFYMPLGPWPQRTITLYDDHTGSHEQIAAAMRNWNRARVGVRFRFTHDERTANVVIAAKPTPEQMADRCRPLQFAFDLPANSQIQACVDWQGYKPFSQVRMAIHPGSNAVMTISHELGHVLGLAHRDDGCSVMRLGYSIRGLCGDTTTPDPGMVVWKGTSCGQGKDASWRLTYCPFRVEYRQLCGPGPDDVREALRLYGGPGNRHWTPWCKTRQTGIVYFAGLQATVIAEERWMNSLWDIRKHLWPKTSLLMRKQWCQSAVQWTTTNEHLYHAYRVKAPVHKMCPYLPKQSLGYRIPQSWWQSANTGNQQTGVASARARSPHEHR